MDLGGEVAVHEVGHEVEIEDLPCGDVAGGGDESDEDATGEGSCKGDLAGAGSALVYSSYLGGSGTDGKGDTSSAVALDITGNAYIVGSTYSQTFLVTTGAYQQKSAGTVNQNGITANDYVHGLCFAGDGLRISCYRDGSLCD